MKKITLHKGDIVQFLKAMFICKNTNGTLSIGVEINGEQTMMPMSKLRHFKYNLNNDYERAMWLAGKKFRYLSKIDVLNTEL